MADEEDLIELEILVEAPPPEINVVVEGSPPDINVVIEPALPDINVVLSEVGLVGPQGPTGSIGPPGPIFNQEYVEATVNSFVDTSMDRHVESDTPHPVYDDGPSFFLLYQNAKV